MTFASLLAGTTVDPTAPDLLAPAGLVRKRGKRLFHSTFADGSFDGWRDHFAYGTPRGNVGLTRYPLMSGSHAMMISTGENVYGTGTQSNSAGTYKNLTRPADGGLASFSGFFALAGEGDLTTKTFPWASWGIGLDTQKWDDTARSFFKVECRDDSNTEAPGWFIRSGSNGSSTDIAIPNSRGFFPGGNERKWNFAYLRLTVDLSANAGAGGYHEFQVGTKVFDLRGLGAGSAPDLILSNGSHDDFTGGFNPGVTLTRSTKNTTYRYNALVADDLVCTFDDVRSAA